MALSKKSVDFLFEMIKHFDSQFGEIADNCFNEVNRALNEILEANVDNKLSYVLPYGVYNAKNNYQLVEPMEFFVVLPSHRESVSKIENIQKKQTQKHKRRTIKDIYESIAVNSTRDEYGNSSNLTAFDVATTIKNQLQKYLNQEDKVYSKQNVVFLKLHITEEIDLPVIIYVGYKFENDEIEYSKLGYKMIENISQTNQNILTKNQQTDGNYLVLCKLFKMLELELVINEESNVYLSKKSIFVESILYNVPNEFFEGDNYTKIFTNIVNFIKNCDIEKMVTVDGSNQPLFTKNGYYSKNYYSSFIKKIVYINEYANEMIDNAIKKATEMNEKKQNVDKTSNQSKNVKKIRKS